MWTTCRHALDRHKASSQRLLPVVTKLEQLLDSSGAMYVIGHDHCAQALRKGTTYYHGVGGAHQLEPYDQKNVDTFRKDCPTCETLYYAPGTSFEQSKEVGAFATFAFSADKVIARHFHSNGTQLYEVAQLPRKRAAVGK